MARRLRRYRRRPQNTVWQPWRYHAELTLPANTNVNNKFLGAIYPGVVESDTSVDSFDDAHILERIRGAVLHNANGGVGDSVVLLNTGIFVVPKVLADKLTDTDMPNLFHSDDGEDYPLYQSHICGTQGGAPSSNIDQIDNKAKRRLSPGDILAVTISWQRVDGSGTVKIQLALNFRILWKLLT